MAIKYHEDLIQGSEEWKAARCGIWTASKVTKLLTPTLKIANNDDSRGVIFDMMLERMTGRVEDNFQTFDMMRGHEEQLIACQLFSEKVKPLHQMGFVTNDEWGFTIGWSPDGLTDDDGFVECKSRKNKIHIKNVLSGSLPGEDLIQVQTGYIVGRKKYANYISYSNGLEMWVEPVEPNLEIQEAIIEAVKMADKAVSERTDEWNHRLTKGLFIPTEYREPNNGEISAS